MCRWKKSRAQQPFQLLVSFKQHAVVEFFANLNFEMFTLWLLRTEIKHIGVSCLHTKARITLEISKVLFVQIPLNKSTQAIRQSDTETEAINYFPSGVIGKCETLNE